MTSPTDLAALLTEAGPWTFAYVDGPSDQPQSAEESRQQSLRHRLSEAGAPDENVDALIEAVDSATGLPSPSARYLLARSGRLELDESFTGARHGPEKFGHAAVPPILPLLRQRSDDIQYLVVETGREGARLRRERAARQLADEETEIDGRDNRLPKVQAGGLSHARYHRHSEEVWAHNQSEIAAAVDDMVRRHRPDFVVIAGDGRARQLLQDKLAPQSRALIVDVDVHTRAAGADDAALEEAIAQAIADRYATAVRDTRDRAAAGDENAGASGVSAVLHALQQAQVETLLLDARMLEAEERLRALDSPPWAAENSTDTLGAAVLDELPVAEALARAAVLSGARVLVLEEEPAAAEPRNDQPVQEPVAVLRWSDDDAG